MAGFLQPGQGLWWVVAQLALMAFAEKSIQINDMAFPKMDLGQSGQLIPLLIGISSLMTVVWEALRKLFRCCHLSFVSIEEQRFVVVTQK
jgi:hypothetical protein